MPRWASDITVLWLNTGITVITVNRGNPTVQLTPQIYIVQTGYCLIFISSNTVYFYCTGVVLVVFIQSESLADCMLEVMLGQKQNHPCCERSSCMTV